MKIYQNKQAPNPRRVRLFMAEKNIDFDNVEFVDVDIVAGDNLTDDFKRRNPISGIPVLELENGTCLSESVAICRYFEAINPKPPLMGRDALDQATVEMWNRRMELNFLLPVAMAFRHTTGHFKDREKVCPEYGRISYEKAQAMFDFMNKHLANSEYVAGDAFSIADITALCTVDFARVVKLRIGDDQPHLKRWHEMISARPSAGY